MREKEIRRTISHSERVVMMVPFAMAEVGWVGGWRSGWTVVEGRGRGFEKERCRVEALFVVGMMYLMERGGGGKCWKFCSNEEVHLDTVPDLLK